MFFVELLRSIQTCLCFQPMRSSGSWNTGFVLKDDNESAVSLVAVARW